MPVHVFLFELFPEAGKAVTFLNSCGATDSCGDEGLTGRSPASLQKHLRVSHRRDFTTAVGVGGWADAGVEGEEAEVGPWAAGLQLFP